MASKRFVIIDGYSLLYRAFFATRYLSTSDGRPTNALYGFVGMIFYLLENVRPDCLCVALDAPGKTFRHADFPDYKGTRKETADELKVQLVAARELIAALGIESLEVTGYEADDIVGTLSCQAERNGYETTIVTGDLDSLQLVDEHVSVLTTRQGVTDTVTYGPEAVKERYGFGPEFIPDYKAIVGDSSDNIPGVPGIGAKGAAELIQTFGTIEEMLARFEQLPPKFQKKIAGVEDQMRLSKSLATIQCDAPVTFAYQPFQLTAEQMTSAQALLESYEFKNHLRRLSLVMGPYLEGGSFDAPIAEVVEESLEVALERLPEGADALGRLAEGPYALYFAAASAQSDLFEEAQTVAYLAQGTRVWEIREPDARRLLGAHPGRAILHDAKPHYRHLPEDTAAPAFDTMLAGYVLQSDRSNYMLRDLVQAHLDFALPTRPEQMAAALYYLEGAMRERLIKEEQLSVLADIELPLIPILSRMERLGVRADKAALQEFSKQLEVTLETTTRTIYEMAGEEFNIGSPKQLGVILFEKMQIPGQQKTKIGYATGAEILQLLAPSYPICTEILTWRELTKLKSTYAEALGKLIQPDGRIHTTYNQTVAATGRLSSNDPNLQNIPIRTELGRGIRKAFLAADGYRLASFDYSQIELRLLAHLCDDEALVEAFQAHQDVHTVTAQLMFKAEEVSKEQRRYAKMLNYAVLYGVTDFGLANQLGGGFSIAEAKALIDQYNERFPKVKAFTTGVIAEARSKGFTTTLTGRRRYFPDIHNAKLNIRRGAERQAMNAPIQGSAADMLKLAMIGVDRRLSGGPTRMLLNVHDELVFELADGDDARIEPIRAEMENALPISVPIEVDAKIGPNWNEMIPVPRP